MTRAPTGGSDECGRVRGQFVLVAAAMIALALVPILLAYLQLGYGADVRASGAYTAPERDGERTLERAVHDASTGLPSDFRWGQRRDAAREVRDRLDPRLDALRESRIERGTVYAVSYNGSTARAYARTRCPRGEGRRFGRCEAHGGVVLQGRAGETHLLAVAFDLAVTDERGRTELTVVVRAVGGVDRRAV